MKKKMIYVGVSVVFGAIAGAFGYWLGRRDKDLNEFDDADFDDDCDEGCCNCGCCCSNHDWGYTEPPTEDGEDWGSGEDVFDEDEGTGTMEDDDDDDDFDWNGSDEVTESDFAESESAESESADSDKDSNKAK